MKTSNAVVVFVHCLRKHPPKTKRFPFVILEPRHEQQLGHEWVPPKEELLQQELDTFSESGTTTGKSTALESADMGQSDSGKFSATKVRGEWV